MIKMSLPNKYRRQIDVVGLALIISVLLHIVFSWGYGKYSEYQETFTKLKMLNEVDPLTISSTDTTIQTLSCKGGTLHLPRHVKVTKALKVTVHRSIKAINVSNNTSYNLPDIVYSEINPMNADVTYRVKIPEALLEGDYLYTPILNYKVNKYLTIAKAAPSQFFRITRCE